VRRLYTIAIAFLVATRIAAASGPAEFGQRIAAMEDRYGIRIHCAPDPATAFPASWLAPALALECRPLADDDTGRMVDLVERFLAAHPDETIARELKHIHLFGSLGFRGRAYGGTHAGSSMYVVGGRADDGYTDEFILQRLHSEFSSILLEHHPFPTAAWVRLNPARFNYSGNGFEMLGRGDLYEGSPQGRASGFLLNYCMSSTENDFNMLSAWLFTKPAELAAVARQYPAIQGKLELAETFYRSVSASYLFD